MKLADLPTMLVVRTEKTADGLRLYGRFDRLEGVREAGYFRLARLSYAWAHLRFIETEPTAVEFTDARDPDVSKLRVGERYTWLDDYWQAPLVEAIADESTSWSLRTFRASDAQYFRQGDVIGWQPVDQALPEGVEALEIKSGAWDHEHCDLCGCHIDAASPRFYMDSENHRLCPDCYERHARTQDVSFQIGV